LTQKNKGNASACAGVAKSKGNEMSDIDYGNPNATPPMGQAIPLGLQHVLAMFASNVTPSS
jgi:xanthine/uracil permease